jgi:hypothetical protein
VSACGHLQQSQDLFSYPYYTRCHTEVYMVACHSLKRVVGIEEKMSWILSER